MAPSEERRPPFEERRPRRSFGKAVLATLAAATVLVARQLPSPFQAAATLSSSSSSLSFAVTNPEYSSWREPPSLALYPWSHVAEPHRASLLVAVGALSDASYGWTVSLDGRVVFAGVGASCSFNFTAVASLYSVELLELDSTGATLRSVAAEVVCKYVRREIRKLSEREREAYFSAMEVVAVTLSLDEGQALYGADFVNLRAETLKHVHGSGCSPFHGGLSFFTAHQAFTFEVDKALKLIDPTVATPYWDVTLDAATLGLNWSSSVLFSKDWFGPLQPKNAARQLEGRFANTSVPTSCGFEVHNAYCRVTDERNEDSSPFVTRAHEFCGLQTDLALPGCAEYALCTSSPDLVSLHACAEEVMHGNLHTVIGGFYGCPYSLGDLAAEHPDWSEMLMGVGSRSDKLWQHVYGSKKMKCPLQCDADADSWETCHCSCPDFSPTAASGPQSGETALAHRSLSEDALSVDAIKLFFNETGIIGFAGAGSCDETFVSPYVYEKYFDVQHKADGACDYSVKGLDNDDNKEFLHFLAMYSCSPGKFGAMSTAASANDPVFWPIHPFFDRLLHYQRLSATPQKPFDLDWPDATCRGHSIDDALPFARFRTADAEDYLLSNRDLLDFFDPANQELDYIFAEFDMAHCDNVSIPTRKLESTIS